MREFFENFYNYWVVFWILLIVCTMSFFRFEWEPFLLGFTSILIIGGLGFVWIKPQADWSSYVDISTAYGIITFLSTALTFITSCWYQETIPEAEIKWKLFYKTLLCLLFLSICIPSIVITIMGWKSFSTLSKIVGAAISGIFWFIFSFYAL